MNTLSLIPSRPCTRATAYSMKYAAIQVRRRCPEYLWVAHTLQCQQWQDLCCGMRAMLSSVPHAACSPSLAAESHDLFETPYVFSRAARHRFLYSLASSPLSTFRP